MSAVLKVGGGRGFVVPGKRIVTAAHCLPFLPPAHPRAHLHEYTYPALVGPLNGDTTIAAECLFVDPVTDIAVLCAPDNQALADEAEAFENLLKDIEPLVIGDPPKQGRKRESLAFVDQPQSRRQAVA